MDQKENEMIQNSKAKLRQFELYLIRTIERMRIKRTHQFEQNICICCNYHLLFNLFPVFCLFLQFAFSKTQNNL